MLNQCNFIGRLGRNPEIRYTQNGKTVVTFSIACSEKRNGQEFTEWVNIVTWDKLAEICHQYLTKGQLVYIGGRMQTRSYEKDGSTRYTTEIIAREMKMLGGGKQESAGKAPDAPYNRNSEGNTPNDTHYQQTANSGPYRPPEQQSLVSDRQEPPRHQPPGYDDVPF